MTRFINTFICISFLIGEENGTVITDGKQIAEYVHFVHIAEGIGEITDHYYGDGLSYHPSINAIRGNNGIKGEEDCLKFQLTNATQIDELLSNENTRKACGHDMLLSLLIKESLRAIDGRV